MTLDMNIKLSLVGILVIWNLVSLTLYAIDKHRAKKGQWRISEKTLLLVTLLFGGLGAISAGHLLHHKTRKGYFQITWWLGVIIVIGTVYVIVNN